MVKIYEKIWMQYDDTQWGETTWCQDKMNDDDTEYVRADIAEAAHLKGKVEGLELACEAMCKYCKGTENFSKRVVLRGGHELHPCLDTLSATRIRLVGTYQPCDASPIRRHLEAVQQLD